MHHPLLLIWGTRDRLADPRSAGKILAAVPGSRLVTVVGAGHCPAVEAPHQFADTLITRANEAQ